MDHSHLHPRPQPHPPPSESSSPLNPMINNDENEPSSIDKEVLDLLANLENFTPIIPESLVDYYMIKCGVNCDDTRLKRLVALIIQKFITDVTNDAMNYNRLRTGGSAIVGSNASNVNAANVSGGGGNASNKDASGIGKKSGMAGGGSNNAIPTSFASSSQKKPMLAMEDLVNALQDYGINIKRPYYYS